MTRSLVTGGAGFLGRALTGLLLEQGDEVVVLDDLSSASPLGPRPEARFVNGDVVDPPDLGGSFDRVFHLASPASPPRYLKDPVKVLRTGAEGTRAMMDLAASWDALFLFSSTSEIYGDPEEHPQTEAYPGLVRVTSTRACYDEAKRYAEALVYAYQRSGRLENSRVVRIFNTYGPGMDPDDGRVVSNFINQALAGEALTIYGDGSQTRSFCYVDDLVRGILLLSESDVTEPVNIGNPHEMTVAELADLIEERLGDHGRVYRELPESDPVRRRPDISKAKAELGWAPEIDLETGITNTVEYFRAL